MTCWSFNGPSLNDATIRRRRLAGERMPLVLCAHQGLGDHLICQGMYRTLAEDWDVEFLVIRPYVANMQIMLGDVKGLRIIPINVEADKDQYCRGIMNRVILRIGFSAVGQPFDTNIFDQEFYRHAQVPFEYRWSKFKVPDVPQISAPDYKYDFIHDRPEMFNAKLDMPGIQPNSDKSIFAHRDLILKATALHCVSSSFAAFADSLVLREEQKLFFHPFGREIPKMRHPWSICR